MTTCYNGIVALNYMYQLLAGVLLLVLAVIVHRKVWSFKWSDESAIAGIIFELVGGIGGLVMVVDAISKLSICSA